MSFVDISSFNLMTSLNHIKKNGALEKQWQYKKKNAITEDMTELQRKNAEYKSFFEKLEEQNGDETLQRIMSKWQAGGKLSANEMLYLQKTNPTLYQQVVNAEREAEAYEEELRRCETKDEVRRLKMNKINASIAKIQSAERAGVPEGARLALAQAELNKIQQIERITTKFIESGEFDKLPTDAEKFEAEQAIKEAQREILRGEESGIETEIKSESSETNVKETESVKTDEAVKIHGDDSFEIKIETKSEIGDSKRTVEEIENSQEYKKIKGNKVKKTYVKVATDFNPKVAE
ncbi:MAG: hypothetical protein IJC90_05220 [Clostridia bacterium]|nr:hypothetical protein [Clostridia bacterium]